MPQIAVKNAQAVADVAVTLQVETVILTIPGVTTRDKSEQVSLTATALVTAGAGTTAITARLRRGADATGVLVGEGNAQTAAAGNTVGVTIDAVDTPGEVAGQSYVLTLQQTAATGNGTSLYSAGAAIVGT